MAQHHKFQRNITAARQQTHHHLIGDDEPEAIDCKGNLTGSLDPAPSGTMAQHPSSGKVKLAEEQQTLHHQVGDVGPDAVGGDDQGGALDTPGPHTGLTQIGCVTLRNKRKILEEEDEMEQQSYSDAAEDSLNWNNMRTPKRMNLRRGRPKPCPPQPEPGLVTTTGSWKIDAKGSMTGSLGLPTSRPMAQHAPQMNFTFTNQTLA